MAYTGGNHHVSGYINYVNFEDVQSPQAKILGSEINVALRVLACNVYEIDRKVVDGIKVSSEGDVICVTSTHPDATRRLFNDILRHSCSPESAVSEDYTTIHFKNGGSAFHNVVPLITAINDLIGAHGEQDNVEVALTRLHANLAKERAAGLLAAMDTPTDRTRFN